MDDKGRMKALHELELRAIRGRRAFDTITDLVAKALDCPVAMVTVFDEESLWFLGKTGTNLDETPRSSSLCEACLGADGPLLVEDASTDQRFRDHPLVTAEPKTRSYLAVPLKVRSGAVIGTLCAISPQRQAFQPSDVATLAAFAFLVEEALAARIQTVQLKRANVTMQELNQLFQQAETAANIGAWSIALESNQLRWSKQVFAIHGLDPESGIDVERAISFYDPLDRPRVSHALNEAREAGKPFRFEANITHADGTMRRVRALGERIDVDGQPHRIAGIFLDCTDEFRKTQALEHAATHDQLTGLLNRAGFDQRLKAVFDANPGDLFTLVLIDLDGFKGVNDNLGHLVGDSLLAELSQRLNARAPQGTIVARWGGDEFALLLPAGTSLRDAMVAGQALVDSLAQELVLGNVAVSASATCGIAQMEGCGIPRDLIRRADLALYFGKNHARGAAHCWTEELEVVLSSRQSAIAKVNHALAENQAFAAYQPIVAIDSGAVVAVEALLRLRDSGGAILTGSDVFAAFADPHMSRKVFRFIIGQVFEDAPLLLQRFGPACQIAINVSEADLRIGRDGEDFVNLITRLTKASPLKPQNIYFEVTETMLLRDETGQIRDGLNALDRLGYKIALDDFGTGCSSLTHLRDFPIRKVKIDKEFTRGILDKHQSRMIIHAIVQMSRSLGLDVVAEGVENAGQESFLRAIGCPFAQGYRYGRPASISEWSLAAPKRSAGSSF